MTIAGGREPLDEQLNSTLLPADRGRFKLVIRTFNGRTVIEREREEDKKEIF